MNDYAENSDLPSQKKLNLINHNLTFDEKTLAPFIQLINVAIKMKLEPICHSVHN